MTKVPLFATKQVAKPAIQQGLMDHVQNALDHAKSVIYQEMEVLNVHYAFQNLHLILIGIA